MRIRIRVLDKRGAERRAGQIAIDEVDDAGRLPHDLGEWRTYEKVLAHCRHRKAELVAETPRIRIGDSMRVTYEIEDIDGPTSRGARRPDRDGLVRSRSDRAAETLERPVGIGQ